MPCPNCRRLEPFICLGPTHKWASYIEGQDIKPVESGSIVILNSVLGPKGSIRVFRELFHKYRAVAKRMGYVS